MNALYILIAALGGYLLGSIPFGLVITNLAGLGDIRAIGSGNIGFFLGTTAGLVAGAAAFAGHCFPVWLNFKGGKGVATFVGTVLVVAWPVGLAVIASWLITAAIFRISSLGALVGALAAPVAALVIGRADVAIMTGLLAVMIFWLHRANIGRILKGEEPRIGGGKKAQADGESKADET